MGMYPGPSYPDHPTSEELSVMEVDSQIHKVLDLGVNPKPGPDPIPLCRGVASVRVSTSGPVLVAFAILSFHHAHDSTQGLGGDRGEPRDASLPIDAARREVRHTSCEET
jgi:hypothetical protein